MIYKYEPQAGDTTIDEALGLLEEAIAVIEFIGGETSDIAVEFKHRARKFISSNNI